MFLLLAVAILNVVGGWMVVLDKSRAKRNGRRVPEAWMWLLASLGGWPLMWGAMQMVRHKTQKRSFRRVFWINALVGSVVLGFALLPLFR